MFVLSSPLELLFCYLVIFVAGVATTLILPGDDASLNDAEEIRTRLEHQVAGVSDAGACPLEPTTVIDLSAGDVVLVRQGRGGLTTLGLSALGL